MADRGIGVVRAHLAKLPPAESRLSIAKHRAQYERAERIFPDPPRRRGGARDGGTAPANGCARPRRGQVMPSSTSTAAGT